jgi:GT2 family glycosyltransferase
MLRRNDIRLYVVVPVYNNWEDTLECLRMLQAQTTSQFRVIIADDGSPSPPPSSIHGFAFAEYVRNPNRGFAANCNAAAMEAIARGATHLLFLNNDTSFSSGFIECWLSTVAATPDGILSPMVYLFKKPSQVWYSGGDFNIWMPFFTLKRDYRELTPVDIVCGCALLVPAKHWRLLDGFDENFRMYFEDFDFSLRAKAIGCQVYIVPHHDLKVRHKVSGSFRGAGAWRRQYMLLSSRLIFIRRHYSGLNKCVCLGLSCAHLATIAVLSLPEFPKPALPWRSIVEGFSTTAV